MRIIKVNSNFFYSNLVVKYDLFYNYISDHIIKIKYDHLFALKYDSVCRLCGERIKKYHICG